MPISSEACKILVYGLSHSQIDEFLWMAGQVITRFQHSQTWGAHLVFHLSKTTHSAPLWCTLHWLPVQYRSHFKLCPLVQNSRHICSSPPTLLPRSPDTFHTRQNVSLSLWSDSPNFVYLAVPHTKCGSFGNHSLSECDPSLLNKLLPPFIKLMTLLSVFKKSQKTFLFTLALTDLFL